MGNFSVIPNESYQQSLRNGSWTPGGGNKTTNEAAPQQRLRQNDGPSLAERNMAQEKYMRHLSMNASRMNDGTEHGKFMSTVAQGAYDAALREEASIRQGTDAGSVARTHANASMYSSDNSLEGNKYNADSSRASSKYNADSSRASSKYSSDNSRESSQYSSDSSLTGTMYSANKQAETAAIAAEASNKRLDYDANRAGGKEAREAEAHAQKMGHQAQTNARRDTEVFGDDNKKDDAKSDARYNVANEIFRGFGMMDEDSRNAIMPQVKTVLSIFDKVYDRKQMYGAAINPFDPKGPKHRAMPNYKGAKLERQEAGGGYLPNGTAHGYYLKHNGKNIPLGHLDSAEYALILHNIATGSWDINNKGAAK